MKLDIFDFDGTIFHSPEKTKENLDLYAKSTGKFWPHRGWWSKAETLEPPLVPDPAPVDMFNLDVVDKLLESKTSKNTITRILTGRLHILKNHVARILNDQDLLNGDVKLYCLGENGPIPNFAVKPHETLNWKIWIIRQYVKIYPEIDEIEFWEDRIKHVQVFKGMEKSLERKITVNYVR